MTDETELKLAAWLDGALSDEEAKAFEAEMARDPELAARAESWKANDSFMAGAFAPLAEQPIDPAMLARLGLAADPAQAPLAANDNPPWWRRRSAQLAGGAIAAGLVLVLVLNGQPQGAERDPLSLALDTTPSLHQAKLPDGSTIEPRLTVRAADGRWCREFASAGKVALACRETGGWKVLGEGQDSSAPTNSDGVVLAGGQGNSPLDTAYGRIGASDPLDQQQEADLIAKGWSKH